MPPYDEKDQHLTSVQPHVNLHAARRGEALVAVLTLKRLDARVSFHMCCEGALDSKRSEALFTLKGLLMGVDADVSDKVTGFLELLGAVWAAMPANAIFLPDGAWKTQRDMMDQSSDWCCTGMLLVIILTAVIYSHPKRFS